MNDNPIVGEFSVAPSVPFMPVSTIVSDEPGLGWREDQRSIIQRLR